MAQARNMGQRGRTGGGDTPLGAGDSTHEPLHSQDRGGFAAFRIFPRIECGVLVFSSVSAPRPLPSRPPSALTHSLTLTHTHTLTLTHTHTHSLSPTHSHSLSHTHSHTKAHSPTLTHSLPHPLTLSLAHSQTITHSSVSFAWQAWDNVHCHGVGCTPWRPSGSASFVFAWRGTNSHPPSFCVAGMI